MDRRSVLEEAFAEALRINDGERRQQALCIVGRSLAGAPIDLLSELCLDALRKGGARLRVELVFSDLAALRPLIEALDAHAGASIGGLVDEMTDWFP